MSTEHLSDDAITQFLRTRSADLDLGLLDDIMRTIGATPQDRGWRGIRPVFVPRRSLLMIALALLLVTMGAIAVGSQVLPPELSVEPARLPTTPDAWERVAIVTPQGIGSVASLATSPHGLLAVVQGGDTPEGGDGPTRLVVSTDGRNWTPVPEGQHPILSTTNDFGLPSVLGTDRGFLLIQLQEVWMSEDGNDWRRLAAPATDPDLFLGSIRAAAEGGPGLVAVGGERAWHSVDASDWTLAAVPALPEEILARPRSERYVELVGVTAAGNDLVAWGIAEVPLTDNRDDDLVVPLLWASHDGREWTDAVDPQMTSVHAVAGGPDGFVAIGRAGTEPAGWFSGDGQAWERITGEAFESRWPKGPNGQRINNDPGDIPIELRLASAASGSGGYVVVGGDGLCDEGFCASDEAVIWTSADGRSWSRVPSHDRFSDGYATSVAAWGSRFVVGGLRSGQPAIWISEVDR